MADYAGYAGWFGFGEQVSDTGVAPTVWLPFISETLTATTERLISTSIQGTAARRRTRDGNITVAGDIVLPLVKEDMGVLLYHALGACVNTAGTDQYDHWFDPTETVPAYGLSLEVNRGGAGVTSAFRFIGSRINTIRVDYPVNATPTMTLGIIAKAEQLPTLDPAAAASPSYADVDEFAPQENDLMINDWDSSPVSHECLGSWWELNNNLKADKFVQHSQTIAGAPRNGHRMVTGGFTAEFDDFTLYNRCAKPTCDAAITMRTLADEAVGGSFYWFQAVFARVIFTGSPPLVSGPELIEHEMTFEALYDITNSENEIRVYMVDNDALSQYD